MNGNRQIYPGGFLYRDTAVILQTLKKKHRIKMEGLYMCSLYTIGYEGRQLDDFISLLDNNEIKVIIDVREIAISRRSGFSKSKLSDALYVNGIEYVHFPSLGSPKNVRHQLREDHDYSKFFTAYRLHASHVLDDIMKAMDIAERGHACLLCYEHDPSICHRSVLSGMMNSFSNIIEGVVNIL